MDAFKYGKAVIGSATGGIPEVIEDQKNGLLFKQNHSDDLAYKIYYLEPTRPQEPLLRKTTKEQSQDMILPSELKKLFTIINHCSPKSYMIY